MITNFNRMKPLNTFLLLSLIALEARILQWKHRRQGNKGSYWFRPTQAAMDDASFSCMVDGKEVSANGTDQNINAAFHLTGDDKGQIFFRLSDMNNTGDKFIFQVPAKRGSTTFTVSSGYSYAGYTTSDLASYIDDPVTVAITSITASGSFGNLLRKIYPAERNWQW